MSTFAQLSLPTWRSSSALIALLAIASAATRAAAEDGAANDETLAAAALDEVVVTARHRLESAQDVPLAISVIGGPTLERDDIKSVWDVVEKAPNIQTVGDNARKVSISIRGIGRNGANDSAEGSVSTIVDGVSLYYAGQAWADYVDLDRIEVLRGPQGTLLGKNSTLGAVNIVTRAPSFEPESSYQIEIGDRKTLQGRFSSTGAIVEDRLAFRGSFVVDRANGLYENTYQTGESWNEKNRLGGRVQFLLTPSDRITNRTIVDYLRSEERVNLSFPLSDGPAAFADGTPRTSTYLTLLRNRRYFDNADGTPYQPVLGTREFENAEARPQQTNQHGISDQLDWTLGNGSTLTSITAYRHQNFDIKNGGQTKFYIGNGGQQLWNEQLSEELRFSSPVREKLDYQVGLYYLDARVYSDDPTYFGEDAGAWYANDRQYDLLYNGVGAGGAGVTLAPGVGRELLRDSLKGMYQSSVTDAQLTSFAVFGQLNWHLTDAFTLTFGARDTLEDKTNRIRQELDRDGKTLTAANYPGATPQQLAAAQAIRANRIDDPYDWIDGEPIDEDTVSWLVSPTYHINDRVMLYASAAQGVKSGFIYFPSGFGPGDVSTTIAPEESLDFELGIKSRLANRRLLLNANLYRTEVQDYQTSVAYVDPRDETTVLTRWENADGVTAQGVEYDLSYGFDRVGLTLTLNGSYNLAEFETYFTTCPDLPPPARLCDLSGKQVHGAPKRQINAGVDYEFPLAGTHGRVWINSSYRSGTYLSASQSPYTYQPAYNVVSGGVAVTTRNEKYEIALVGRNLTNEDYAITRNTYGNTSAVSWIEGEDRYLGLRFRGRL